MRSTPQANHLSETLSRLEVLTNWESRPRDGMRQGLEPMLDLMRRLGNPHLDFRSVHVTGTKGKGSVCALIEAGLQQAGLKVGRYGSPHVEQVTERVSILQTPASESDLAAALICTLDVYESAVEDGTAAARATWFDILTSAAFLMFSEAGLNWVVVEVGLGGRLDSTNVVDGEVCVITNIELEHTEVLGLSREAIAYEKAGILKERATLITTLPSEDAAGRVLQDAANAFGCAVLRTTAATDTTIEKLNLELAGLVLDELGKRGVEAESDDREQDTVGAWLLDSAVRRTARLPGRMEQLRVESINATRTDVTPVTVVLDGAHVPFNIESVLKDLQRQPALTGVCVAIVGLAADKDAAGFLEILSPRAGVVVCTELPGAVRSHPSSSLDVLAKVAGASSFALSDWKQAFSRGLELALEHNGWLLVTGSLHLVGAVRSLIHSSARHEQQ